MSERVSAVSPLTLAEETMCHIEWAGIYPVLRIEVKYPQLVGDALGDGGRRFNETYGEAAQKFVAWAVETLAPVVREEFRSAGRGAAYRFVRREAVCCISADRIGEADVAVSTCVFWGRKGEEKTQKNMVCEEVWRFPQGWIHLRDKNRVGQIAKIVKSTGKLLKKSRKCGTIIKSVP